MVCLASQRLRFSQKVRNKTPSSAQAKNNDGGWSSIIRQFGSQAKKIKKNGENRLELHNCVDIVWICCSSFFDNSPDEVRNCLRGGTMGTKRLKICRRQAIFFQIWNTFSQDGKMKWSKSGVKRVFFITEVVWLSAFMAKTLRVQMESKKATLQMVSSQKESP